MHDCKALLLQDVIEKSYQAGEELTLESLCAPYDNGISSSELAQLLCTYINSMQKIVKKEDLTILCLLKQRNQDLLTEVELLQRRYNTLLHENIKATRKQITLKGQLQELEFKNLRLTEQIKAKDRQLKALGVMKAQ